MHWFYRKTEKQSPLSTEEQIYKATVLSFLKHTHMLFIGPNVTQFMYKGRVGDVIFMIMHVDMLCMFVVVKSTTPYLSGEMVAAGPAVVVAEVAENAFWGVFSA